MLNKKEHIDETTVYNLTSGFSALLLFIASIHTVAKLESEV